jgi:YesN/AraC family two-component response regulator
MRFKEIIKSLSILYIEDDVEVQKDIVEILNVMFKVVYQADNAVDGFDLYLEKAPDVILSDINLPKMSGIEFIKEIRERGDNETYIIILSAYDNKEYLLEAVKLNLEEYIIKPLSYSNLSKVLEQIALKILKSKTHNITLKNNLIYVYGEGLIKNDNNKIYFTLREKSIFELLLKNRGFFVEYEMIENSIWRDKSMSRDSLKTLISRLKNKLGKDSIISKSTVGYKLNI